MVSFVNIVLSILLSSLQFYQLLAFGSSQQSRNVAVVSAALDVFEGGQGGYACYRIPSLLLTTNSTLIAFAEGRKYNCNDGGYIDLVAKRSFDFGVTWTPVSLIYSNSTASKNTNTNTNTNQTRDAGGVWIGNPAPVQDTATGRIWMIFCRNDLQIWSIYSDNDGESWMEPTPLTSVNNPAWIGVWTGPPAGLEVTLMNNNSTRLLIPYNYLESGMFSTKGHVLYSDDHGEHWQLSAEDFGGAQFWASESQAVQLKNGSLFINARTNSNETYYRIGSVSDDGGNTFVSNFYIPELRDTTPDGCEGSMIMDAAKDYLYYSGVTPSANTNQRMNLTLHTSADQGNSWQLLTIVEPGASGYSSLVDLPPRKVVGDLYERYSGSNNYLSYVTVPYLH